MISTSITSTVVRRRFSRGALCACLVSALATACSSEVASTEDALATATELRLHSRVDVALAEASEAVVAWNVTSGPEDYAYVWGRAPLSDGAFTLSLASEPPAEAINSYGLAVGLVMVVPVSAGIKDGRQSDDNEDSFERVVAASARHAIVYVDLARANAATSDATIPTPNQRAHWLFEFEQGYSCGLGQEAPPEETFDSYVPTPCETIELHPGSHDFDFPDWT
jgi:hypothetical protein